MTVEESELAKAVKVLNDIPLTFPSDYPEESAEQVEITNVGMMVVVRFRWRPDNDGHQYLLFIDHSSVVVDSGTLGPSVREAVDIHLGTTSGWKTRTVALSSRVSVVTPAYDLG